MVPSTFYAVEYIINITLGAFIILQVILDEDQRSVKSYRSFLYFLVVWMLTGLFFLSLGKESTETDSSIINPLKVVAALLMTPFFLNYVLTLFRKKSLVVSERVHSFIPFFLSCFTYLAYVLALRAYEWIYLIFHVWMALIFIATLWLVYIWLRKIRRERTVVGFGRHFGLIEIYLLYMILFVLSFQTRLNFIVDDVVCLVRIILEFTILLIGVKNRYLIKEIQVCSITNNNRVYDSEACCCDNFAVFKVRLNHLLESKQVWRDPDITMEAMVSMIGTNRTYFSQIVNSVYGQSFRSMLNSYRLEESRYLLNEYPTMKVFEVALKSGFSSSTTMSRLFHKKYGLSPSDYRNQHSST